MSARSRRRVARAGCGQIPARPGAWSAAAFGLVVGVLSGCGRSGLDDAADGFAAADGGGVAVPDGAVGRDADSGGGPLGDGAPVSDSSPQDGPGVDGGTPPFFDAASPPFDGGPGPSCNAVSCSSGCCDSDGLCEFGVVPSACGSGGAACVDCASMGAGCLAADGIYECSAGPPPPACDPSRCGGCCDANGQCQPGFVDDACGQAGAHCLDCAQARSRCNAVSRTCANQTNDCSGPYAGCAGGRTPTPAAAAACSVDELSSAQAACTGGAHTVGCASFFRFEAAQNPACAACLRPFDFNFTELTGLFACVAPFLDATCNTNTFCLRDCVASTCAGCADNAAAARCENDAVMGTCAGYVGAASCIAAGLSGPGAFCNPQFYFGFGDWLQSVGASYCGL